MRFQILSHAGLLVSGSGRSLVCDPWILGSTYWRSWWNYPPVQPALIESLHPDFIYLTHIHWDHFHGPSLRHFPRETPILVPKGHLGRLRRDLKTVGFRNVIELRHGETFAIAPDFRVTSYQFFPMPDSSLLIESEGVTLFNANDSKFMGAPLAQILRRHPKIDFVFRSHSSANSRLCYEITDGPGLEVDDPESYLKSFAAFATKVGARYAIPFASNHCYLHREVFHFNETVRTPYMVQEYFREQGITSPEVVVMVSGDAWDSETGFALDPEGRKYFDERERYLAEYQAAQQEKLTAFYEREARTKITLKELQRYFEPFFAALPWFVRRSYRGHPIRIVLTAGERTSRFEIDLWRRTVREVPADAPLAPMPEIHTAALVLKHAMAARFCAQMAIGKRVRFRTTARERKYIQLLMFLFNLYESELLPMRTALRYRFAETWTLRWREVLLYCGIVWDRLRARNFTEEQYILATRV